MRSPLLSTDGLTKEFGPIRAVDEITVGIDGDKTTALIGPNGAGKTTFFNLLTGALKPTSGEIWFNGERISGKPPYEIARAGITRSYQITNFFPELTALENVRLAAQVRETGLAPSDFLRHHDDLETAFTDAYDVLGRLELEDVADRPAHNLSHGQQRHLEMGIAFATDPELLLLDEPTAGMSPEETVATVDLIKEFADQIPMMIVEHDMDVVMGVADVIAVMHRGSVLAMGPPKEIRNNEKVQEVYLQGGQ